jgi:predicted RNA binding protein YcfA (HicA-like mRNA interferase family)
MPKLPSLSSKEVIRILKVEGFILDRSSGSHMVFRNPFSQKIVVVPVHRKELPKGTLMEILRQAGISKKRVS